MPSLDQAWAARFFYAVAGLGVCAGAFVVVRDLLLGHGLWFDEIWYPRLLYLPLAQALAQYILTDVHPPMYLLLLGGWIQVFGATDVAVRSLSVLGALGTLGLFWWRGEGQASRVALALASLWLATHWMWAIYAREARMYALAMLGGCWLALAFARLWNAGREPGPRELWLFCLGALLVALLHYSALALACSALLLLWLRFRRRPRLWPPLAAAGALCIAWSTWHAVHMIGGGHIGEHALVPDSGALASAFALWNTFFPGRFYHHTYLAPTASTLLVWGGLLCVYGLAVVAWLRRGRLRAGAARAVREDPDRALLRSQLPLLGVFLAVMSLAHEFWPLLVQKVLVVVLPSLALCVGCVGAILWRTKVWVLCALSLALAAISLPVAIQGLDDRWLRGFPYHRDGFRELALLLEEEPAAQRVYCMCGSYTVEAFWDSIGLEGRHPRGFARVTRLRPHDARHLVPPLFLAGTQERIWQALPEEPGLVWRPLGEAVGGYPLDSIHAFRAYQLLPGGSGEPR